MIQNKIIGHSDSELEVNYFQDEDIVSVSKSGPWVENYVQSFALARERVPEFIAALQAAYDEGSP